MSERAALNFHRLAGATNPQGEVRASEHDNFHTTSLPSTELAGHYTQEHVGGVGALPGTIFESEVAKVPDERNTSIPTAAGIAAVVAGGAAAAVETVKGTTQSTAQSAKQTVGRKSLLSSSTRPTYGRCSCA